MGIGVFFFPFCNLGIGNKAKKNILELVFWWTIVFISHSYLWGLELLGDENAWKFYHSRGVVLVFTVVLVCIFLKRLRLNFFPIFLSAICIVSHQVISQAFYSFSHQTCFFSVCINLYTASVNALSQVGLNHPWFVRPLHFTFKKTKTSQLAQASL